MSHRAKWLVSATLNGETNGNGTRFPFLSGAQETTGYIFRVKTWQVTASSLNIFDGTNNVALVAGTMTREPLCVEESYLYLKDGPIANSQSIGNSTDFGGLTLGIGVGLIASTPYGVVVEDDVATNQAAAWSPSWYISASAELSTGMALLFNTYASNVEADLDVLASSYNESGTATFYIGSNGPFTLFWRSVYDSLYGGQATLSGSVTFAPLDYWPYANPDGDPIYNTTTGEILAGQDPLN